MTTFTLVNPPPSITSWEIFQDESYEVALPKREMMLPLRKGDLVVTLYQGVRPVWRWVGSVPDITIPSSSTVEVNPLEGTVYLVSSEEPSRVSVLSRANLLKVGLILGTVGLVLGKSSAR